MNKYKLTNLWEEEVATALEPLVSSDTTVCTCPQCQADMMAYALNRLKPMYTTALGRGRMRYLLRAHRPQLREQLNALLEQAITQVKERPRQDCLRIQAAPSEPDRA